MEENEIIRRIAKIDAELAERGRDNLANYNRDKVHKKQMKFHRCKKRNRWVFGGNRSGKTECGAVEAVWLALGSHPFRQNRADVEGWVVSPSYEVQREVAQKKILHYLKRDRIAEIVMQSGRKGSPESGVIDFITVKNAFGGRSKIAFKSCDQGREKFQGASLDFVWFDEEPPKDIYEECLMRVLDRRGDIFGTMTPLKGLSWVYDEIFLNRGDNPEVWHVNMEWADNPFLSRGEIKRLSRSLDADSLETRRFGRFSDGFGLIYTEFEQNEHVVEPFEVPDEWKSGIAIDPGLNNPLACLFFAVDYDGNLYVIAEHYEAGRDIDYHARQIKKIADSLNWPREGGRLRALIDSAANQRTLAAEKSVCELFFERGIAVNPKVDKSVFAGIAKVKTLLKERRLFIFSDCKNLVRELKTYRWGKGDSPVKKDDHALDALRYFAASRFSAAERGREPISEVAADKARLIRKIKNERRRI